MFFLYWADRLVGAAYERTSFVARYVTFVCLVCTLFTAVACGSASSMVPTPAVPQISGDWLGEETVATLNGGECLAAALEKDVVGLPGQFTGSFQQTGSSVIATLDIDHTGAVCNYSGTIDGSSLSLDATGCTSTHGGSVTCPSGAARDLLLLTEHLTAVIADGRITGSFAETDNVLVPGSTTSVGTLGANGSFVLLRR
jgi:hypothetical protein